MIEHRLFGPEEVIAKKECVECEELKPLYDFPKHIKYYDKHDTRCYKCKTERHKLVRTLKKTAPLKPKVCDCCGQDPLKPNRRDVGLSCDHDPIKLTFRGWLCRDCNTGIGLLGDDIEGLERAIKYLKKWS